MALLVYLNFEKDFKFVVMAESRGRSMTTWTRIGGRWSKKRIYNFVQVVIE
jgi:hypothetical protein